MKKEGIKIFKTNFLSNFWSNMHVFSIFSPIAFLKKINQFIFILMIIFLYNNNYKLM